LSEEKTSEFGKRKEQQMGKSRRWERAVDGKEPQTERAADRKEPQIGKSSRWERAADGKEPQIGKSSRWERTAKVGKSASPGSTPLPLPRGDCCYALTRIKGHGRKEGVKMESRNVDIHRARSVTAFGSNMVIASIFVGFEKHPKTIVHEHINTTP
jgi:hypothetical protein